MLHRVEYFLAWQSGARSLGCITFKEAALRPREVGIECAFNCTWDVWTCYASDAFNNLWARQKIATGTQLTFARVS